MNKIFIGSNNKGKLKEFADAFSNLKLDITNPNELGIDTEIDETGNTFLQNSLIKARVWVKLSKLPTLVDDSGLCVDYLEGKPGVLSARFIQGSDNDRNLKILELLKGVPLAKRTAHYTCVIAFIDPKTQIETTTTGICEGVILEQPSGKDGFGYDPIFQPLNYSQSFGELPLEIKQQISHRAKALAKMVDYLKKWSH
ncbi:non-canonical purine NTP pyrophosphatase, RdgB/HAM1 family [Candidatus Beckwithbacteria bacterium CG23_combo_of_CG06-09_8_20_14_all_34_8]|uniref:dITP/XTP pyrophosphatase n=1 Tax=Candidatus Beckwithbacteria bacterium CG23_combo_of_CG06-09_8_20_14_all_34_8 TaxID=1974497 RepID=A0A2H0B627_9BACT|nr:MAG: non-canonical purine NTP pyrophosphatase, RdgB/HAM1 family [Candidatus Beckwithbacteria bacterium CG23_combo_of_CG06-09_8_20_14_all_34_8]